MNKPMRCPFAHMGAMAVMASVLSSLAMEHPTKERAKQAIVAQGETADIQSKCIGPECALWSTNHGRCGLICSN